MIYKLLFRPKIDHSDACLTASFLLFTTSDLRNLIAQRMFYEPELSPSTNDHNATLVITKTLYLTATTTVTTVIQSTATETGPLTAAATGTASLHKPTFHIPHHPKVDTAFTAVFGVLCIVLITGIVIRKKSKKLKSFNIPLILGTFCTLLINNSNISSRCIRTLSPCRLQLHQQKI